MSRFEQGTTVDQDPSAWFSAYLDGLLSEEEFATFAAWLGSSEEHRREFAQATMLHTNLQVVMQHHDLRSFLSEFDSLADDYETVDPRNIQAMLDEAADDAARNSRAAAALAAAKAKSAAEAQRRLSAAQRNRPNRPRPIEIPLSLVYLGVATLAASLFIAVSTWWNHRADQPEVVVVPPAESAPEFGLAAPVIARITRSTDAKWASEAGSISTGSRLSAGPILLKEGMAEVALDGGASVVLEAPVAIELLTSGRLRLEHGKLVAQVPEEAIGFTVSAGGASVVDLGTEFGLDRSPEGDFGVHVLDGKIALNLKQPDKEPARPAQQLLAGSARRVDAEGLAAQEIEMDDRVFIRQVPASSYELAVRKFRPLVFWRFNEPAGSPVANTLGLLEMGASVGSGVSLGVTSGRAEANNTSARFTQGHKGIVLASTPECRLTQEFSIQAWVRAPANTNMPTPQRIVSTFAASPNAGFALGVAGREFTKSNDFPSLGVILTLYGVYDCVSMSGLRPGGYHHVAVTVSADGTPTMYIDGKRVPAKIRAELTAEWVAAESKTTAPRSAKPSDSPVVVGRNPSLTSANFPPEAWTGEIDELAIFDRSLSPEEIQSIYQAGQQ